MQIAALDWSGELRGGGRTKIWSALADDGRLTDLVNGRSREEIADYLIALGDESPDLVIGLDFAFSMPEWFVRHKGAATGKAHLKKFETRVEHPDLLAIASSSEDAFDAAVSAIVMSRCLDDLGALPPADAVDKIEGRIWKPVGALR